ncbi:TPR repeat-containing protein [Nitrosococcus halophilus Nc 4]|uniref:TPR repeat-containing protein n=1 Tax=Nitrosococcus halophilus (strain Nc4) TaxID=472759 RepID=D5C1Y2_NITHN|nr:hypothetical protein [Nitrosococcus halophilus]ADE16570.1 TPR repeat-containing protein [Nitrosococcus halophilus Nc 4]
MNRQGLDVWHYGVAIDQRFSSSFYAGTEFSKRDLRIQGTMDSRAVVENWDEYLGRAYFYWTLHPRIATSTEYHFKRLEQGKNLSQSTGFQELETHRIPISINFFHPSGLSTRIKATFIDHIKRVRSCQVRNKRMNI